MADADIKPLYAVKDVVEAACDHLPAALADDVRAIARMVPKADKDRFFRDRRVASWVMIADTLGKGKDSEAGRLLHDMGEGDGIDARSITREIGRFRKRHRWYKILTFCRRMN